MSYAAFGLGQVSGSVTPGALVTSGVQSVLTDATLTGSLSPQARILLQGTETAIESVLGKPIGSITESIIANISSAVSDSIASLSQSIASEISDAIPIIGSVIGFITSSLNMRAAYEAEQQAAYEAGIQECVNLQTKLIPVGEGAGGAVVPADLFGVYYNYAKGTVIPPSPPCNVSAACFSRPTNCHRPILGDVLIRITEGGISDGSSSEFYSTNPGHTMDLIVNSARSIESALASLGVASPFKDSSNPKGAATWGIPSNRRAQFAKLRKAIESQRCLYNSDGGMSLWPTYLDMLVQERAKGHLTYAFAQQMISSDQNGNPLPEANCPSHWTATLNVIFKMMDNWLLTVQPVLHQDIVKQQQIEAQAAQIARQQALAATGVLLKVKPTTARAIIGAVKPIARSVTISPSTAPKKMSPALAIGLGAGAAGLSLLVLRKRARDRVLSGRVKK